MVAWRVGFSLLTDITASSAEFYIALHPDKTGRGIGRQLTEGTLRFAFDTLKPNRVYLKVRKWHSRGIELYKHVGFAVTGQKEEYVQGNVVEFYVMEISHPPKGRETSM
jgi:diamine N-acetyltransferase